MTDEVVAFTLAENDPARRRRVYWLIGITLFTSWNIGTALGVLLGGATGDPAALGLDAAFPAGLIALIMPSLRDRQTRLVALTGAAIAVLLTPVLPTGLPVLCALLGLVVLFRPRRRRAPGGSGRGGPALGGPDQRGPGHGGPGRGGPGHGGGRAAGGSAADREGAAC
jgi:predicted branched-subunit amino acid permease